MTVPRAALLRLHNLHDYPPAPGRTAFPGVDIWRWQYFEGAGCPASVTIPVDDPSAWELHPGHRRIYNKLFICESQGIPHGPHGVTPDRFPVFSKPMMNLHGMGTGGFAVRCASELEARFTPGHMWMPLLTGRHISTDAAVADGTPRWWRHTEGKRLAGGMFDYWVVLARRLRTLEAYCSGWVRRHLRGFTGIVNLESISGTIIECHLRMSEQWLDLNGPGWLQSVVELYARGRWRFDGRPRVGYSVALFGPHGPRYWIDPEVVQALRRSPGISSIQITFDPRKPPERHAMPPGGFRLAIVNCWDLAAGLAVRDRLTRLFHIVRPDGSTAVQGGAAVPGGRHGGTAGLAPRAGEGARYALRAPARPAHGRP